MNTASLRKLDNYRQSLEKPNAKNQMTQPELKPAIKFEGVTKTYTNGTQTLEPTSFEVKPNTMVSIVGPSGCGKSTLLRLVSGLEPASTGKMIVDQDSLGYVFQDATLLPWRTVLKNVELFAELHGIVKSRRRQAALKAIALVGLTGFENQLPKSLSGGMRMRVSLARTLVMEPTVCLFDEPFGALDEISRERLHDELLNIHQQQKFTGLFVTHSIQEAVYLSNRVLVMSKRPGRIVADITIDLPTERSHQLRFSKEFSDTCQIVQAALKEAYQ